MKLQSPWPYSERILVFGGGGTGKTTGIINIAEVLPDAEFHVLEKDVSPNYERMLPEDGSLEGRFHVTELYEGWEEYLEELDYIVANKNCDKKATPPHERPWLVIDSITPTWLDCQRWWLDKAWPGGSGEDELMRIALDKKMGNKEKGEARANIVNYQLISPEYAKSYRMLTRWRGNLYVTAQATNTGGREKPEVAEIFGPWGSKPKGQPDLHFVASTNLLLVLKGRELWTMTTCKDRKRVMMEREPLENLAMDYLYGVGGWKLKKGEG